MKIIGIHPNGRILESLQVNMEEEIALIEDIDTEELLWRYFNKTTSKKLDYNFESMEDIWFFKAFLIEQEIIKGA